MGYVEKRGKNTWRITTHYTSAAGTREVARMTLHMDPALSEAIQRRDAERELDRLDKRLKAELAESYTVRQWSEIWLQKHVGIDGSPVTVHNYRYLLNSRILPVAQEICNGAVNRIDGIARIMKEYAPEHLADYAGKLPALVRMKEEEAIMRILYENARHIPRKDCLPATVLMVSKIEYPRSASIHPNAWISVITAWAR